MSIAALESIGQRTNEAVGPAKSPEVLRVSDLPSERYTCARADRLIKLAGESALASVEIDETKHEFANVHEAVVGAANGNETARKLLETNVLTDVFERTVKAGMVQSVPLEQNKQGQILQHGQMAEQIQKNTIRFGSKNVNMQARYKAEVRNMFRMEHALREGLLEDNVFVVFSLCPDDMTNAELDKEGFFVHTKSMALQLTSLKEGQLMTETAFLAGAETAEAERFDAQAVQALAKHLNVSLPNNSTDLLDAPILVPKELVENGVIDLVKILDDYTGRFFGQNLPKQDYKQFRLDCERREQEMAPTVQNIVNELLANADKIKNATETSLLLDKLSAKHTLDMAIEDVRIDARVFGSQAAWYLQDARTHYAMGDMQRVQFVSRQALRVETSSSCPGGAKRSIDSMDIDILGIDTDESSGSEKLEDCEFVSLECPKCGAKNVKTTCRSGKYYGACGCTS